VPHNNNYVGNCDGKHTSFGATTHTNVPLTRCEKYRRFRWSAKNTADVIEVVHSRFSLELIVLFVSVVVRCRAEVDLKSVTGEGDDN